MAEMIQVQVEGSFRLKRGEWYLVQTTVRELENGKREFGETRVELVEGEQDEHSL